MAERVVVPEKLAARPSGCPMCGDRIDKGEPIRLTTTALGWAHAECAEDYPEAREKVGHLAVEESD